MSNTKNFRIKVSDEAAKLNTDNSSTKTAKSSSNVMDKNIRPPTSSFMTSSYSPPQAKTNINNNNNNNNARANDHFMKIFDPEPSVKNDEAEFSNEITYLDDNSFIIDDHAENSQDLTFHTNKNNGKYLSGLRKENNLFIISETPEPKTPKLNSRASSRTSLVNTTNSTSNSNSTHQIDTVSNNFQSKFNISPVMDQREQQSEVPDSKNTLMDALVKKFNLNPKKVDPTEDVFYSTYEYDQVKLETFEIRVVDGQRVKIKKENTNTSINKTDVEMKAAGLNRRETVSKEAELTDERPNSSKSNLGQTFECRYMGKTPCEGLWGKNVIRKPIDKLVRHAKKLKSVGELPNVRVTINEKGIEVSEISGKHKNGQILVTNISYAAQDYVYGKIFSTIVIKEKGPTTSAAAAEASSSNVITECYSFLCPTNEQARRMALAITLVFQEYAKYLNVKKEKKNIRFNDYSPDNNDSFA